MDTSKEIKQWFVDDSFASKKLESSSLLLFIISSNQHILFQSQSKTQQKQDTPKKRK
jgi:hypothetical protein